ncbi:MAG: RidA family protein [Bacillota bacterium]
MVKVEDNLRQMGLTLPEAPKPVASYVPFVRTGNLIYTSGQICMEKGEVKFKGKAGREYSVEQAYEAAQLGCLNALAVVKAAIGDLDRVSRVVKVVGFVNSAPGFNAQPKVVNGASDLLVKVFGEAGKHARSAVGCSDLPMDTTVEVEMVVEVKD